MANKSSQKADWERNLGRAENARMKQNKMVPTEKAYKLDGKNMTATDMRTPEQKSATNKIYRVGNMAANRVASLASDAKKAALKKLSK